MIARDFLGTDWRNENIPLYLTEKFSDLDLNYFPNAYYIGYISDAQISNYYKFSSVSLSDSVLRIYPAEGFRGNIPVALLGQTNSYSPAFAGDIFFKEDKLYEAEDPRFVNKVELAKYAYSPRVGLGFQGQLQWGQESLNEHKSWIGSFKYVDWFEFKAGTVAMDVQFQIGSGTVHEAFYYWQITGNKVIIEGTQDNYIYKFELYLTQITAQNPALPDGTEGSTLMPALYYSDMNIGIPHNWYFRSSREYAVTNGTGGSWYYQPYLVADPTNMTISYLDTTNLDYLPPNLIPFSCTSTINQDTLLNIPSDGYSYTVIGDIMYYKYTSRIVFIIPLLDIDEIEKMFYWGLKTTDDATQYYGNDVWYPEMVNNQYVGNLIHVANQAEAEEVLEEFQQEGEEASETNHFTEEDIPPAPDPEDVPDSPDEIPIDEEPEAGPDKNNRGAHFQGPTGANYPANPTPFVKYGIFTYEDLLILSEQLWNKPDSFFESLAGAQKVNPMDFFISLRWYPFLITAGDPISAMYLGSGGYLTVNHTEVSKTVHWLDWGVLKVEPFYKNFLDYDPYTKIFLYLPFCGQIELNTAIVMEKTLNLSCGFDIADGTLTWLLWNETDGQPVHTAQCHVGCEIPITGLDASQMSANIVNATLSMVNTTTKTASDLFTGIATGATAGSPLGPAGTVVGGVIGGIGGLVSNATNLIGSFANLGMASKDIPQLMGGTSGFTASGFHTIPSIIYQRPLATNPNTYGKTVGYLCNKTKKIGDMSGYTICKNVDTSDIAQATEKEKATIKQILDSGFFV